jgi:hypothetical protein
LVNERADDVLVYERPSVEQLGAAAVFAIAAVTVLILLFTGGATAVIGEDQSMRWVEVSSYYLPRRSARVVLRATTGPWGVLTLANGDDPRLTMRLVSADGARVDVPMRMRPTGGGPALGKLVQERIVKRIYSPIRVAFDRGDVIEFGPVSLSTKSGLVFKGIRVAPSELRAYSLLVHRGRLVLGSGRLRRGDPSVRWDRVPNVDIFLSLFYELKKTVPTPSWA